jgi:hypothetical protein
MRQFREALRPVADENVARIFARETASQHQSIRQHRRHVLGGMHGDVDCPGKQRFLDFLGKKPFAAGVRQRTVLNHVAGGADDLDFDVERIAPQRRGELRAYLRRLRQRQRTAARADAQRSWGRGLHSVTSQC